MTSIPLLWPFVALPLGFALLARQLYPPATLSEKLRSPAFLCTLLLPIYMIHQFEEHGYDIFGNRYAFRAALCSSLGYSPSPDLVDNCPCSPSWIMAINVGYVWIAGAVVYFQNGQDVLFGVLYNGLVFANSVVHILSFVATGGQYNPGLATAILFFVPLSVYTYRTMLQMELVSRKLIGLSIFVMLFLHGVILLNAVAISKGLVGSLVSCIVWYANALIIPYLFKIMAGSGLP